MFPLKFNLQTGTHDDAVLQELSPAEADRLDFGGVKILPELAVWKVADRTCKYVACNRGIGPGL